jgi:hypothetical protein
MGNHHKIKKDDTTHTTKRSSLNTPSGAQTNVAEICELRVEMRTLPPSVVGVRQRVEMRTAAPHCKNLAP